MSKSLLPKCNASSDNAHNLNKYLHRGKLGNTCAIQNQDRAFQVKLIINMTTSNYNMSKQLNKNHAKLKKLEIFVEQAEEEICSKCKTRFGQS